MTTAQDIAEYVKDRKEQVKQDGYDPIFALYLFTNPNKEKIYVKDGKEIKSGFPDTGGAYEPGFYYTLEDAVSAMNENRCDIRETCYDAGFVLCRFPGLYEACCTYARMYFVWDEEKRGFFQAEEPEIFRHVAY